jgi:hypothetical protein
MKCYYLVLEIVKYRVSVNRYCGRSFSVLRGGIRDQFPGDPRVHFCNGYFEVYLFFNKKNIFLLKIMAKILLLSMCLFSNDC